MLTVDRGIGLMVRVDVSVWGAAAPLERKKNNAGSARIAFMLGAGGWRRGLTLL